MREQKFGVRKEHRAGIRRAAQWHDHMSKIFRDAISERINSGFEIYGELLWKAEEHEAAASRLRELLKQP